MQNKGPAGSLLRDYVVDFLKTHNFGTEENYKRYIEDRSKSIEDEKDRLKHQKKSLETQLSQKERMYKNLLGQLGTSKHITEETLDDLKDTQNVLKEQIEEVASKLKALEVAPIKLKEFLELYKNTGEILRLTTSMTLADEIIKIFFSNITVEVTKESLNAKQKQWSVVDHTLREPFDKLDGNGDNSLMAGPAGFEPANAGTKTQCLTAWRRSNLQYILPQENAPAQVRGSSQQG